MRLSLVWRMFLAVSLTAAAALAQNNRSFVSTSGSDANSCGPGNECRSFTRALAVTNAGGEIVALTSGGYGAMNITQAVSILATTGAASITSSTTAVTITAGPGDRVVLRGLNMTITGIGLVLGVYATGYKDLSVENCTINGGFAGVYAGGGPSSIVMITDTTARDATVDGFEVQYPGVLVRCRALNNVGAGLHIYDYNTGGPSVAAVDFVSVGNQFGVQVETQTSGHDTELSLDHALLSHNSSDGVVCSENAGAVAHVSITNSTVVYNGGYGLDAVNASISSMKNNMVVNNSGGATNGTIDPITAQ